MPLLETTHNLNLSSSELLPWTAFTINGPDRTYHASRFIFSSFVSLIFLFVSCGGLSWLHSAFYCTLNTLYRIVCITRCAPASKYMQNVCLFYASRCRWQFQSRLSVTHITRKLLATLWHHVKCFRCLLLCRVNTRPAVLWLGQFLVRYIHTAPFCYCLSATYIQSYFRN